MSTRPQTPLAQQNQSDAPNTTEQLLKTSPSATSEESNTQNVTQNAAISLHDRPGTTFMSKTIAPSPPPTSIANRPSTSGLTISLGAGNGSGSHSLHPTTPSSAGLRLQTDIPSYSVISATDSNVSSRSPDLRISRAAGIPANREREPSVKQALANSIGSGHSVYGGGSTYGGSIYGGSAPSSAMSSPMLGAMSGVTPLPSPLMSNDSPGPWKKLAAKRSSKEYILPGGAEAALVTSAGESVSSAILNQGKRKAYHGLVTNASESGSLQDVKKGGSEGHERSRSVSEYTPEAIQMPKGRQQAVSGSHIISEPTPESLADPQLQSHMRREPNLAVKRGIAPTPRPPTPPSSRTGGESSDSDSSLSNANAFQHMQKKSRYQYFDAHTPGDQKKRRWRALKLLGEGTFSKVMLATSQVPDDERIDENHVFGQQMDGLVNQPEVHIDRKKLVAVKICEHGPKGGASEERVEMSLKRELEIMKTIHHPCLVNLKAWNIEETRAILVLSYCPGGDLFDVASQYRQLLVPSLLRRMISELVTAIQYLHERHIVHRDIKLENVLVNLPPQEFAKPNDWITYPYSVITLTDLGLSRRVADDEKLTTRCGSDDYAAPEVIMGQPYDGRAVDAWSLGVLLYALLESRLPFDPSPGMSEGHKQRSKTSHRIARVEWCWAKYAGDDGDHEGDAAMFEREGLTGAMEVVEGLLKRARSRWTIEKVAQQDWVKGGIEVEGGVKFREEDTPEEV